MRSRETRLGQTGRGQAVGRKATSARRSRVLLGLVLCISLAVNGAVFVCISADDQALHATALTRRSAELDDPAMGSVSGRRQHRLSALADAGRSPCVRTILSVEAKPVSPNRKPGRPDALRAEHPAITWLTIDVPSAPQFTFAVRPAPELILLSSVVLRI